MSIEGRIKELKDRVRFLEEYDLMVKQK